jgi:hypothetical protein
MIAFAIVISFALYFQYTSLYSNVFPPITIVVTTLFQLRMTNHLNN